jgi:general secretion pathway protein M
MKAWWDGLAQRERRFVLIGGVVAAIILLAMLLLPLNRRVSALESSVEAKAGDLAWMRSVAPTLASAGPAPVPSASQESIVVLVDRAARESGLGEALASSEPSGDGGQRLRLEQAHFDRMVAWLARLREQHGVQVESATIEGTEEPGLVSATLVLRIR